jgi:hypothetical protein
VQETACHSGLARLPGSAFVNIVDTHATRISVLLAKFICSRSIRTKAGTGILWCRFCCLGEGAMRMQREHTRKEGKYHRTGDAE